MDEKNNPYQLMQKQDYLEKIVLQMSSAIKSLLRIIVCFILSPL